MVVKRDSLLTPLGRAQLYFQEEKLIRIGFSDRPEPESFGVDTVIESSGDSFATEVKRQLTEYFEGTRTEFSVPLLLGGSLFSQRVLEALRKVPFGKTISYRDLALLSGTNASRAVGTVMRNNSIPIIIPCHRVIKQSGQIGGFSAPGGVDTKRRLLAFEQQVLQHGPKIFR